MRLVLLVLLLPAFALTGCTSGEPSAVPISQHTTDTPESAGTIVASRSGSASAPSTPAASSAASRSGERVVPLTACSAESARASERPRHPHPTTSTRATG